MNSERSAPPLFNSVVMAAGIAIVILSMRAASDILSPILLAMVLAITASPLINWLKRRGAPSWLALLLTIVLVVVVILGIGCLGLCLPSGEVGSQQNKKKS